MSPKTELATYVPSLGACTKVSDVPKNTIIIKIFIKKITKLMLKKHLKNYRRMGVRTLLVDRGGRFYAHRGSTAVEFVPHSSLSSLLGRSKRPVGTAYHLRSAVPCLFLALARQSEAIQPQVESIRSKLLCLQHKMV